MLISDSFLAHGYTSRDPAGMTNIQESHAVNPVAHISGYTDVMQRMMSYPVVGGGGRRLNGNDIVVWRTSSQMVASFRVASMADACRADFNVNILTDDIRL